MFLLSHMKTVLLHAMRPDLLTAAIRPSVSRLCGDVNPCRWRRFNTTANQDTIDYCREAPYIKNMHASTEVEDEVRVLFIVGGWGGCISGWESGWSEEFMRQ